MGMQDLEAIVARASADFAAAADPASLENAKATLLGKAGELTALLKQLGSLAPEEKKSFGQSINAAKQQIEAALDSPQERPGTARNSNARLAEEALDVTLPGRGRGRGGLHPISRTWQRIEEIFALDRLRRRRRPGDRDRLVQLHRAQQPGEPSGALDAGHVLRRHEGREGPAAAAAHAHQPDAGALRAHAQAADQGDRAGPHLPRRLGRHALADVPPGRGPVDRRGHQLRGPEGRVHGFPAPLLRDPTSCRCASGRRSSRSPSPRPRSTCSSRPARSRAAGWRSPARARCIRRWCAISASTRRRYIGFAFGSGLERLTMLRYGIDDLRLFFDGDLRFLRQFS